MRLDEQEAKEDLLAKGVLQAQSQQVKAHLEHDLELVRDKLGRDKDSEAVESMKDAKYLRERQMKLDT